MKCSRCQNMIQSINECNICKQKFCSEECLISHSSLKHQSNISSPTLTNSVNNINNFSVNKSIPNLNNNLSPLLVKGIYNNKELKYDQFFSLDNFTTIEPKGKLKVIGNGSFGQVYLAKNKLNKRSYAIKHMNKEDLLKYFQDLDQIYREIDIQSRANHPNIIKLYFVRETKESFDLVLEYAKYGTLFDFILKQRGLPEKLAFKYFIQIVNAIKFLHENNIIHRDIKPENILLFDNNVVKLCDFGWSIKCESTLPGGSFSGTTEYMSPELLNNEDYGKEIDLWMLGILLYELIHGFSPFRPKKQEFEEKELLENIHNHEILFYMPCSDEYKELIFWLLEPDIKKRCTIDDIYRSNLVKKYEKENLRNINSETDERNSEEEYEHYEKQSIYSTSRANTNIENIQVNNFIKMKKNILINRYDNSDDLNDSKRIFQSDETDNDLNNARIMEMTKSKRKESERIISSKYNKLHLNENKDELNMPKNNKRNKFKKKEMNNPTFNNSKNQNNILTNSNPKIVKEQEKKENKNINILISNQNLNENITTRKNILEKEGQKQKFIEEKINIQNIKITNYIFNNKEIKLSQDIKSKKNDLIENNIQEINQNLFSKKLTSNKKNQILSLSLIPGSVDYNSLLNHSSSKDIQVKSSQEKNVKININNLNKGFISPPMNESIKISKVKEFPFDHFTSNSNSDIHVQKTIFNNKMIKRKNPKKKIKQEEKSIEIKDKQPNDNMRKKIKVIKNPIPLDNLKKEKEKENDEVKDNKQIQEIKPTDNYKKKTNKENNKKELNNGNNKDNNPFNEKEKENINKANPISESISQKIVESINTIYKQKNKRNISVRNTNDFNAQKRKKLLETNKEHLFKSENNKNKLSRNNKAKELNNNGKELNNSVYKRNLFINNILLDESIKEEPILLKNINKNRNNSFVLKPNDIKKFAGNKNQNINNEKERAQKLNNNNSINKREKKSRSVNKTGNMKFNKLNKVLISNMSSKENIKKNKDLGVIKEKNKIKGNINIKTNALADKKEKPKIKTNEYREKMKTVNEYKTSENNNMEIKKYINKDKKENQFNLSKIKDPKAQKGKDNLKKQNKDIQSKKENNESVNKAKNISNNNLVNQELNQNKVIHKENNVTFQNDNNTIKEEENNKEEINKSNVENININLNEKKITEENKENLKNHCNKNVIIEKEVIEDKSDNFQVKEIYRAKEIVQNKKNNSIIKINSEKVLNNSDEDIIITKAIKAKENVIKTNPNQKERKTVNNNKMKKSSHIEKTGLKLCLDNISQNLDENSYKENRTTRLNLQTNLKLEEQKNVNLKLGGINRNTINKIPPKFYPKKVGSDSNSSNSSIYEYDIPQNNEESDINNNNHNQKKINYSNSENIITTFSKNISSNISKAKAYSDKNIIMNNSNTKKQYNCKNLEPRKEFEFKVEETLYDLNNNNNKNTNNDINSNKKEINKIQKSTKMYKNKTDGLLNKNPKNNILNNNKNTKKKNAKINGKEKIINMKDINNNLISDKTKILKKKYKKSLTESMKDVNEQNEKGNESESYIIEGDSEYGDCEVFKL